MEHMTDAHKPPCTVLVEDLSCEDQFQFNLQVKNVGAMDGTKVVLVYSKPLAGIVGTHAKQVIGFKRVFVPAGGTRNVEFEFNICKSLGIVDYNACTLPSGEHTIMVEDGAISFPPSIGFQY